MLPAAPGRLSTTTGWPHFAASFSPKMRGMMSAVPPAGNGTMMRTGREGYPCAPAPAQATSIPTLQTIRESGRAGGREANMRGPRLMYSSRVPTSAASRTWPAEGLTRVPYWIYQDADVYRREQERIFLGDTWNFVGLEAELPNPGDFKTTYVGELP